MALKVSPSASLAPLLPTAPDAAGSAHLEPQTQTAVEPGRTEILLPHNKRHAHFGEAKEPLKSPRPHRGR